MAEKKPLVVTSGEIEQLQSGDTLSSPIDLTITFARLGTISLWYLIYALQLNTNMGYRMPWNALLQDLSISARTSSASAAGTFTVRLTKYASDNGTQYSPGVTGTEIGNVDLTSTGAESALFYRGSQSLNIGNSVSQGDNIFCECSSIGFWSITDLTVIARFAKV